MDESIYFELDMTNDSHQCPSCLMERNDSSIRTCVPNSVSANCSSVSLPVSKYSKVCGKMITYQVLQTHLLTTVNLLSVLMRV